jgi:hypothetical protein
VEELAQVLLLALETHRRRLVLLSTQILLHLEETAVPFRLLGVAAVHSRLDHQVAQIHHLLEAVQATAPHNRLSRNQISPLSAAFHRLLALVATQILRHSEVALQLLRVRLQTIQLLLLGPATQRSLLDLQQM